MKNLLVATSLVILIFSGCSKKAPEEKTETVLTTAQEQTLQKAKDLNETAKKQEEERLQMLKQAEGSEENK